MNINQFNLQNIKNGSICVKIANNYEAQIENYKGIVEYSSKKIVIEGKDIRLCVEGCNLSIAYYTNDEMKISGTICSVKYL